MKKSSYCVAQFPSSLIHLIIQKTPTANKNTLTCMHTMAKILGALCHQKNVKILFLLFFSQILFAAPLPPSLFDPPPSKNNKFVLFFIPGE